MPRAVRKHFARNFVPWLAAGAWLTGMEAAPGVLAADPFFQEWRQIGTTEGLPSRKVFAVTVDGSTAWAGTERGVASVEANGRVTTWTEGLPSPVVTALALSATSGDLWVGTVGGLARLSAGRIDAFTQLNSGLANDVVYGIAVDGSDVWVATAAGLNRYETRAGTWQIFDTTNTLMHEPWCYNVTAAEGVVYVGVWGGGVVVRDPTSGEFREHRDPDGEMEIDLFRDDGLVHDVTSAVAVSRGVLWVGSYFGLSRYDGRRWRTYNEKDSGLAGDFVNALHAEGDAVWIATDQGVSRFDSRTWHTWRVAGEDLRPQVLERDADGRTLIRAVRAGLSSNTVYGIAAGEDLWFATASGLSRAIRRVSALGPRSQRPALTRKE